MFIRRFCSNTSYCTQTIRSSMIAGQKWNINNCSFSMTTVDPITEQKNDLRYIMKLHIETFVTEKERRQQEENITQQLLQHPQYIDAKRIGIYLSLPDEVGTYQILKHIFNDKKECFIPRYNEELMEMVKLSSLEECDNLPKTKWNISQPADDDTRENAMETGGLDLLIVPGRAFSNTGIRLGRGKGYYDKYLAHYKRKFKGKKPFTIGLAFNQQICNTIPVNKYDIRLDYILYKKLEQRRGISFHEEHNIEC